MSRRVRHSLMLGALVVLTVAVYQRAAGADTRTGVPGRLSDTGLFRVGVLESRGPGVRAFSPQYPLWSDGAGKARWVRLPEGTTIDVSNPDRWVFPDGTRFWKEFTVGGRKVETRMLSKRDGEWQFASYAWNDAQTDATLVPEAGMTAAVEVAAGRPYRIPSVAECRACHVSGRVEVLGFSALQLSPDRDPGALHADTITPDMVTLRTLIDEQRLSPRRDDWRANPPRIAARDPQTRTVLGYLSANCGSCHNAASDIANLELDLKAVVSPAAPCPATLATTLDRPGRWEIPSAPRGTSRRLTAGRPDLSALLVRMRSRRPSTQMPPLGTVVVDHAAVELLTSWVEAEAATWSRRVAGCTQTD
jgi:hypothetical protein